MQYQKLRDPGAPRVRGTNSWQRSGYVVWLRPGSSHICTILLNVLLNMLDISRWVGFSIPGDTLSSRKAYSYRGKSAFLPMSNLPASVSTVPDPEGQI